MSIIVDGQKEMAKDQTTSKGKSDKTLLDAINDTSNETRTLNDMPAFKSTLDDCLDLFNKAGASRGKDITGSFLRAYHDNDDVAVRIMLWARDVRGGAGERQVFKDVLKYLGNKHPEVARKVAKKIPELGRWDDLLALFGTKCEIDALRLFASGLKSENPGLCAKWMPRKGMNSAKIRGYLGLKRTEYTRLLARLSKTVEQKMSKNQWEEIDFEKDVPALAMARYQKAFDRRGLVNYTEFKEKLETGEVKVKADTLYPYDVIKSMYKGDADVAEKQWEALPNYMEGDKSNLICVVDTSGSMFCRVSENTDVQAIDVAVSLGMYVSERAKGVFKDNFITFSERPELQTLKGSLSDRLVMLKNASWGFNTDLVKVFNLILDSAVVHKVDQSDMPTHILIMSDMQFDSCVDKADQKAMDMIREKFKESGYELPKIVFWNLRDYGNVPVKSTTRNVALVSGFSPSIMKTLLKDPNTFDPVTIMKETVMQERYNWQ